MNNKKPKSTAKKTFKRVTKPKLNAQNEKFVEGIVAGKKNVEAYKEAYPNVKDSTARSNSSKLLANTNISSEIEKRKQKLAKHANIENAQVIGSAVVEAFTSINDVLDINGHFDIKKARRTGAIHRVKSITRTQGKYGESVKIEMYSSADARRELAEYLGLKQLPRENQEAVETTAQNIVRAAQLYPGADLDKLIESAATDSELNKKVLSAKVYSILGNIENLETVQ